MATAPSLVADIEASEPPKLPSGVRTAETINTSFISLMNLGRKGGGRRGTHKIKNITSYCRHLLLLIMAENGFPAIFDA
jgi:hypothetical protein